MAMCSAPTCGCAPIPSVTPPAVALPAAITYYESMGQNWERAAMIKARPVAGDLALGAAFLEAIRPFVWRRGLDFAAVADIHAMKRRIDQHRGGALADAADPLARIAGHNVKLGEGGIREIEFLAQTLQLVWGGRDPALRVPTTLGALSLLARAGHVPRTAARELAAAYRFLRRVEHRLQMTADRQVHELPQRPAELARFATFMGYADAAEFAAELLRHLRQVREHYAEVFELVPELLAPAELGAWSWISAASMPRRRPPSPRCRALGFASPDRIVAAVRGWQAGHVRALRSARARELLAQLLPRMLAALARQPQPDTVFNRFDAFLARQPAGVQLLSLFQRNPGLLDRIAAVLGAAPSLANHLASHPAALDGLLSPDENPDPARLLRGRLRDARLLEDVIEITRRTVREEDFSTSVATMEGRIDADEAGLRRTAIADAALGALLSPVLADFASRFGRVRGGSMAVVAMGKAGGREMMAGSDLDLMLIYDHPGGGERKSRRASHAGEPMVRPRRACLCRGGDRARRGRPAVRGGHAAAAVGQQRAGCGVARLVPPLPRRGGLDVGAHGADARPRGGRPAGIARAHRGGDHRGAGACRRCGSHPRRCRVDARAHAARPAARRPLGREAARRRPDRGGVRRSGAATHPCARGAGTVLRRPRASR